MGVLDTPKREKTCFLYMRFPTSITRSVLTTPGSYLVVSKGVHPPASTGSALLSRWPGTQYNKIWTCRSLPNRIFAILEVCEIDYKVQFRMECQNILWNLWGNDLKITRNGFESVLSQSSLSNAMEICSAIENVLTLTYLTIYTLTRRCVGLF